MMSLFSIGKARHTLQRWILGEEENSSKTASGGSVKQTPPPFDRAADSSEERIAQFMEELRASSQEWLGRVRMINFDSIRERVGPTWPKLQDRVEILAERIIQGEMAGRDRYMKAGKAEFLVFFADATPEESRIRCFAIVEAIHDKLFGLAGTDGGSDRKVAECHVFHRDELLLQGGQRGASPRSTLQHRSPAVALRGPFRRDAEILDGADIAASTQMVIDAIISRGVESQSMAELTPLLARLHALSRSLKTLEPALVLAAKMRGGQGEFLIDGTRTALAGTGPEKNNDDIRPLGTAWDDIEELVSVLDAGSCQSHADLLGALGKLRRARLGRMATSLADDNASPAQLRPKKTEFRQFEYIPIYRSASRGEHIHQGIYRVNCRTPEVRKIDGADASSRHPRRESVATERAILEHAIEYLLDRKSTAHFMLMTSVHVETLRGPSSQMKYSMILRSAQLRAKRRLLIEVVGYGDNDDTIGIRRAIDELRVHSHAVFISLSHKSSEGLKRIPIECKRSRVHAMGLDVAQFKGRNAEIIDAITQLNLLGEQYSIPTFVDGIRSVSILTKALGQGVCYVSAPALCPALPTPDDAKMVTLNDLYSMV